MNSKNRKILIILIIAILVAAAGGVSLYLYLTPQKTTVYVFNSNYESGTALTEKMLTPIRCDSKIVTAGKTADVKSRFITGSDIEKNIHAGMIAVTIPLDSVTGAADGIREGSHINIYATGYDDSVGTTLLFQNMSVIAVERSEKGTLTSATIEVDAEQSLKLINAQNNSTLNLAVVDSTDYQYTDEETPTYNPNK